MYSCRDSAELTPNAGSNGFALTPVSGSPNLDSRSEPSFRSSRRDGSVNRYESFESVVSDSDAALTPRTPTANNYYSSGTTTYVDIDYSDSSFHPRGARPLLLASRNSDSVSSGSTGAGAASGLSPTPRNPLPPTSVSAATQSDEAAQSLDALRVRVAELQHARTRAESRAQMLERQLNGLDDTHNSLVSESDEMRKELGRCAEACSN